MSTRSSEDAPPEPRDERIERSDYDPFRDVPLSTGRVRLWVVGTAVLLFLCIAQAATLTVVWERAQSYDGLVEENLQLKQNLEDLDSKMSEVERILLRLRLYDSQLEQLGEPKGDHGPIPEELWANANTPEGVGDEPDLTILDGLGEEVPMDASGRDSEGWAHSLAARADTVLSVMSSAETNLTSLMAELEELRALEQALPRRWPTGGGTFSSGYGWRRNPFNQRSAKHHNGIDIAGKIGIPIYASASGKVIMSKMNGGFGRMIEIDHGFGITTRYAHCSRLLVREGAFVKAGTRIGLMGSTGHSTGPHLHFEVRLDQQPVNPLDYLGRRTRRPVKSPRLKK